MKRQIRIVPLSLWPEPEQTAATAEGLTAFLRVLPADHRIAILDVDGLGAALRAVIEGVVGAERCLYLNSTLHAVSEDRRWGITAVGRLPEGIGIVIVVSPAQTYLAAMRTVHERFPGHPPVVLPFAASGQPPDAPPPLVNAELGDDTPIVFCLTPNCGTGRLSPSVNTILGFLEKRRPRRPSPSVNRRLVASIEAPKVGYGYFPAVRQALDDAHFHAFERMDLDYWDDVHDFVSAGTLARLDFCKIVALYRDPRDYVVSAYHWLLDGYHSGLYAELAALPKEQGLLKFFEGTVSRSPMGDLVGQVPPLSVVARNFADYHKHAHILPISYEELRTNPRQLYLRMLAWLGIDKVIFKGVPEEMLEYAISLGDFSKQSGGQHSEGKSDAYFSSASGFTGLRKGIVGDWRNHFTPKVKERAKELIGEALIELGYEKGLDW